MSMLTVLASSCFSLKNTSILQRRSLLITVLGKKTALTFISLQVRRLAHMWGETQTERERLSHTLRILRSCSSTQEMCRSSGVKKKVCAVRTMLAIFPVRSRKSAAFTSWGESCRLFRLEMIYVPSPGLLLQPLACSFLPLHLCFLIHHKERERKEIKRGMEKEGKKNNWNRT